MRLFHVSETPDIGVFVPRTPTRADLFAALVARGVEVRLVDTLWPLGDLVQQSTLNWSLCRMINARARI